MNDLNPEDLQISAYASKNTTWTRRVPNGVRVIHKPTNTEVVCEEYRSQHQNRDWCLNELRRHLGLPVPAPESPR